MPEKKRRPLWLRLDNAALIFPAAQRRHWSNAFRISFTFKDPVDPFLLSEALAHTAPRFPSVMVRLRRSTFWYFLEEVPEPPAVREDSSRPLVHMRRRDVRRCAVRVLYYRDRMAVEYFHSVTDGTGALIFAKTLAAEYVRLAYHVDVSCTEGVKDLSERPKHEELEDSFKKHAGPVAAPRDSLSVYRYKGVPEKDRFLHVTLGMIDSGLLHEKSRALGATVTAYLTALLLDALLELQAEQVPLRARRKNVKVQIPVNLRKLFGGCTMRNFVAVANIGADPRLGDYTFPELVQIVHHEMQLAITEKNMRAIFTPNVKDERNLILKAAPLFLKNIIMRAVFDTVGERVSTMTLSNLGNVALPKEMEPFVERVEFIIGPQSSGPYNMGVTSFHGTTFLNLVRNTTEPELEEKLFTRLVRLGFHVRVESNDRG
ncbi:MAG: hypothetical protein IJL78_00140 [Lachnospiraceae bacterium]|nr:hypothetical protein [Lachnospiraceae bacterium]